MKTIYVDRVIEERDVDAALYLLGRMLGLTDGVVGEHRERLFALKSRLEKSHQITEQERRTVVSAYREVIG